jgi:hypothetical protein
MLIDEGGIMDHSFVKAPIAQACESPEGEKEKVELLAAQLATRQMLKLKQRVQYQGVEVSHYLVGHGKFQHDAYRYNYLN